MLLKLQSWTGREVVNPRAACPLLRLHFKVKCPVLIPKVFSPFWFEAKAQLDNFFFKLLPIPCLMCHLPLKAFFSTKAFLLVGFVCGPLSLIATSCPNTSWKIFAEAWAADQWLCHCRKWFLLQAFTTNSLWPGRCGTPGPPIRDGMLWAQPCAGLVWLTRAAVSEPEQWPLCLSIFCSPHCPSSVIFTEIWKEEYWVIFWSQHCSTEADVGHPRD